MIRQKIKYIISMLIIFNMILLAIGIETKVYAADSQDIIKVGYIDCRGFIENKKGVYSGYAIDYLNEIAEYTDWRYEYVYFDTWNECTNALYDGNIDLVCMAQFSQEDNKEFLYSGIPFGYEFTVLYASPEADIFYEDYEAMSGCRVGMIRGSVHTDNFISIANKNGVEFEPVYFDKATDIDEALKNGSIDMFVAGSLYNSLNAKVIGRYDATEFYCMAGRDNKVLIEKLDDALNMIKIEKREIESELFIKYYGDSQISVNPMFTREEHEFIESADTVKVMLMADSMPLSYEKDGVQKGIFVEYLKLLSKKSGLDIEVDMSLTPLSMEKQMEFLKEDNSILLRSDRTLGSLKDSIAVSNPMSEMKLAYVMRKDKVVEGRKDDFVFGLTKEMTYLEDMLKADSEAFEIKYYDSTVECLEALLDREIDIVIQDSYVIAHIIQKNKYADNLIEMPGEKLSNGMCLMMADDNEMLMQVINKTINHIPDTEVEELVAMELLTNPYQIKFEDMLYKYWKPLVLVVAILAVAIIIYTIMLRKMTELKIRKNDYRMLQRRVHRDELTGVYNKTYFYEKVRNAIDATDENMCIVVMDVVKFKVVNELHGMEAGDRLLKYMADMLVKLGEGRDFIIARFTEDHFYVCMREKDFNEIHLPRHHKTFLEDMDIKVVYGVYMVGDRRDVPVNIMCDRAALAIHDKEHKQVGYIYYYSDEERRRIIREQEIENEMEAALIERQFRIYVQPKYDIDTQKITGGEVLVRWFHPDNGMISPGEFIPIFEKNGFIIRLDYYIWEEACKLISELNAKGMPKLPISVNVSRAHFYGNELKSKLEELIGKYDLERKDLEIEITETICAEDADIVVKKVQELRKVGYRIAMDDFGSGYSSLNMLKEMPLDIIKMDLKFLDGGDDEAKSRNILGTLITLAKSLKFDVVVEGVETKEQVAFLQGIGNCNIQGYYFSRPVDTDTYESMLKE